MENEPRYKCSETLGETLVTSRPRWVNLHSESFGPVDFFPGNSSVRYSPAERRGLVPLTQSHEANTDCRG